MKTLRKIDKWFELNVGWFFINGRKQDRYSNYLKDKYKAKTKPSITYPNLFI